MHTWKTLKIFISSTFKDLEMERDQLAQIFQKLQQNIFARRLQLIPIDLRWREQSQNDLARWCVDMVTQCQYFIGILGYRYGWRPGQDATGKENLEKYSITEMEIRQALVNIPKERRFFCVADLQQYSPQQLASEAAADIAAVERLKNWLAAAGERIFVYRSKEEVLHLVAAEIERQLDQDYPADQKVALESYSREEALREIIEEKNRGFVGRSHYLEQLGDFCRNSAAAYLIIIAVAGTGKSSLLAQFFKKEAVYCPASTVVAHYMSMAGDNKSSRGIVQSLLEQLRQKNILQQAVEMLPELQVMQLSDILQTTGQDIVIAIDGLDEMDEEAQELNWLPRNLSSHVRMIMTTRPGTVAHKCKTLAKMVWLDLSPLEDREIQELIVQYHAERQLTISAHDKELLAKRAAGNPLFLKVALDEMAAGGIAVGQLAETVEALFQQIISRLQKRYGEKLIQDYLGVLAAARSGLAEAELREIIYADHPAQASDDFLLPITNSLANFIITREKLLAFFHPEFERSLKILLGRSGMRLYHRRLAAYFAGKGYHYERTLLELAYQLQWGEQYAELLKIFGDIHFLASKAEAGMLILLRQDLEFAMAAKAVPLPAELAVEVAAHVVVDKNMLGLLARILDLDLHFLVHHPQCLFQSLWNRGYWHDAPEAAEHYEKSELPRPWDKEGAKLYKLVAHWRGAQKSEDRYWLSSLRPLPDRIDSPLSKIFRGHADAVTGVALSHDGKLVSGSYDKTLRIWDTASGQCLQVAYGHDDFLSAVAISPDQRLVASASADQTIKIWERESGRCLKTLSAGKVPASVCFAMNGTHLVAAGKDRLIRLWHVESGECLLTLRGHGNTINSVAVSQDGSKIVSGSWDHTVRLWDAQSGDCLRVFKGHEDHVRCVRISPDNRWLASSADDHTVKIWDMQGNCLFTLPHESIVFSLAVSEDGEKLVSGAYGTLRVWQPTTGQCRFSLRAHESSIFSLALSHDGNKVVSCSSDKTIKLWDISNPQSDLDLEGHEKMITAFHFNQKGDLAASGARDNQVALWTTNDGKLLRRLNGHQDHVRSVSFYQNYLASCGDDKVIRVWDVTTGETLYQLVGHEKLVSCVFWSMDGSKIVSGGRNGMILVWDVATRQCLRQWKAHQEDVRCLYLSQDNSLLASGGEEKEIHLWQTITGHCLQSFKGHQDAVLNVALSQDGKQLFSCGRDNTVRFWQVDSGTQSKTMNGNCNVEQFCGDAPHYAMALEVETVVADQSGQPVAFIPTCLRSASIGGGNIVGGFAGIYTSLWQLVSEGRI
jgi:WD40 repeat protein